MCPLGGLCDRQWNTYDSNFFASNDTRAILFNCYLDSFNIRTRRTLKLHGLVVFSATKSKFTLLAGRFQLVAKKATE